MNDVFKYDADYLKIENDTTTQTTSYPKQIDNTGAWDNDNNNEHTFDISDENLPNQVAISFCKIVNAEEICARAVYTTTLLSYDLKEVCDNGEQNDSCTPDSITCNASQGLVLNANETACETVSCTLATVTKSWGEKLDKAYKNTDSANCDYEKTTTKKCTLNN